MERGKNRQLQSEADSNLTGIQEIVQIKTKDNGEPEGAKTKTAGGEETVPMCQELEQYRQDRLAKVWVVQAAGLAIYPLGSS